MPNKIASVPPRQVVIIDQAGRVVPVWHRFFIAVEKAVNNSNEYENISKANSNELSDALDSLKDALLTESGGAEQVAIDGNTTQVLFNKDGMISGDSLLTWDNVNHVLSTVGVLFNTTETVTSEEGLLHWNSDDGTLDIGLPGGDVVLQIGQEVQTPRSTAFGSNITNGQLVYVSGASGAIPRMSLAKADSSATASGTIAMATEDITQNQQGYYTAFGLVRDVNTDPVTYSEGDQLYLSAATAGAYTNVKPSPPNLIIKVGIVIWAHATEGIILVSIANRTNRYNHIRGMTANSIPYADSDGFLTENNPDFTYDGTHAHLKADSSKLYWGAGDDISIYYDGTDAWIKTNEVAASDLNVECGTQKTIELQTVVWDDLRVAVASAARLGLTDPDWVKVLDNGATSVGVYALGFADNRDEEVFFTVQIPHTYKQGTDIYPHVHWLPMSTGTGVVEWQLEYTWTNINGTFGNTTEISCTDSGDGTAYKHQIASFSSISGTGKNISSMLLCRLHRDGGNGSDTYVGDAVLLEIDFHYQINTMGSRQELSK